MQEQPEYQDNQPTTYNEVSAPGDDLREAARLDPDVLAALAMPAIFQYCFSPVLRNVFAWLCEQAMQLKGVSRLALGLPRGFGKTTMVKLFFLYLILFTKRKFILVLAENRNKAINIVADLMDMLEEPNIISLFGDWKAGKEKATEDVKKFTFRGRSVIIAALGCDQGKGSVRGINLKNERPDVILMDDVQSREDADSEQISDKIYKWMLGTVFQARDPAGAMLLFIGNMYPTAHSILKKLQASKSWLSVICGGIVESPDGSIESLWEELKPLAALLEDYQSYIDDGHPEIFHAEVLNDPDAQVSNSIDLGKVPVFIAEDEMHAGSFIVIDPASGKHQGDDITITYFEVHEAKPVAIEILADKFSPGDTIWQALGLCWKYSCPVIFVESNAYQSTLCYWFNQIMGQTGVQGIEVVEIYSGKSAKVSRILSMFKSLESGELMVSNAVRATVFNQIRGFNPLMTNNIDGILDCLTYAPRVLNEFAEYLRSGTVLEQQMQEQMPEGYGTYQHMLGMSPA